MTKLMEWLLVGFLVFSSWIAVLMGKDNSSSFMWYCKWFPVIFIFLFGVYAVFIVLYRVLTFNNCETAAIELNKQIIEARADLEKKGIIFKNKS